MVSKEQALINYISLIKFVIEKFETLTEKIYSSPCIDYKINDFFKEKDPFKIILQWNMFYRKDHRNFYYFRVKEGIEIIKKFSEKNKIVIPNLNEDLKYFEDMYERSELLYKNINFIKDIENLNKREVVENTLEIFNDLKNIKFFTCEFYRNLDLKFPKKFYQFQTFHNEAESIFWHNPDILFSRRIEVEINSYIFQMIYEEENED